MALVLSPHNTKSYRLGDIGAVSCNGEGQKNEF
jgi:hypothetical protein